MYRHRFKIVCFCVLISTVFSYELQSSAPERNQYNQETPDSSGANTNGGPFISYPNETSNSPNNAARTSVYSNYGTWNTASGDQQTGHQQTQTQMDPSSPQQARNPPDRQRYSSAQGHAPLVSTYGGGARTTTTWNTASHGQQTGHQQAQTHMDPNSPQQATNPPDGQQYSSAQGHAPHVSTYGGGARTITTWNTASGDQQTGHQQTQTQMDPSSPQQARNPPDRQRYSSAQGHAPLVSTYGGGARTTTDVNRIRNTASRGQQAGYQQAQTQVDPSFPQQPINFPDGQQYSNAQGHTPLVGTYGGAAKTTTRLDYVCSIETQNYNCQFKDVILKLPQHSVTFGPVPNSKQKLAFQNSTLEYLPKSLLDAFPRMQVLNLEGLLIREIDSNTFQTASELLELYMQNNQLKEIKSNTFDGAWKLQLLDLSNNAIESNRIALNFLSAVPNLQQFKINSNRISQLPLSQQNYYLQYITASENSISHIKADQFKNNRQLSELDFSYNRLQYFDLQQLDDKQNLLLINVNYNNLTALHIPQYVKTLFARNNTIETLSSLEYCAAVEIDLQSNNLQNIDVLSNCNFLQKLDLSSNLLQNFRFSLVENMSELKVLNLSHNHLFQIDGNIKSNPYFNLQTLDFSHNHLSHGPPSTAFHTVIELYLQNNEFIDFDFRSSEKRNVYLSNNEWSCKKIDSINKTTVIVDQFHGECLSGFVKKKGICCREYKKPYIQRLNEVLTEALFHNQTNRQRLATECRSRPSSSRPEILNEDELTRLRNEAATGDDANKKLIDELWNITDLHKKFTKDIKTLEVERTTNGA
ncbi:uncharacterized protein LOC128736151 [Sabethes cyaneus]|uniref:uncharacterized protein LOC128736151 n=1 Tax=Sabethes cyaneus TaxID=53552 RepID=UPI00237EE48D|nr:uncharacterized protein LOC128736151 [Sabethes cyaneus]